MSKDEEIPTHSAYENRLNMAPDPQVESNTEFVELNLSEENESPKDEVSSFPMDKETPADQTPFQLVIKRFAAFKENSQILLSKKCQIPKKRCKAIFSCIFMLLYIIYFIAVLLTPRITEDYWCEGGGFLIIITIIVLIGMSYFLFLKSHLLRFLKKRNLTTFSRKAKVLCSVIGISAYSLFILIDAWGKSGRLRSALGIFLILGVSACFSTSIRHVKLSQIVWGVAIQVMFGLIILRWDMGKHFFFCIGDKLNTYFSYTNEGTKFAYGSHISSLGSYAFSLLPVIFFFGMCISILFYYGILQWIIIKLGWLLEISMGTTPCESMAAVSNIFLGQAEAPLVIRPYVKYLTKSELHAVLTGGFATVAGGTFVLYHSLGLSTAHIMSASIMSAPASLTLSKLIYPEKEESLTSSESIATIKTDEKNVLHAIVNGLLAGIRLIAVIIAAMISFVAFMAFINGIADWGCSLLNIASGTCKLETGLAYPLFPLAWMLGIPTKDCLYIAELLGVKVLISEIVAYQRLMILYRNGEVSDRSVYICTYALCGFTSISSIGNQLSALGSFAPERREDIADVIFRAFIAGLMASCLTACVAGTLSVETNIAFDRNTTAFFNSIF